MKKSVENMRDCVRKALQEGAGRGDEFKKMRHAIILELKRLGFSSLEVKDELLEWNKRCEQVLSPSEQRRQLLTYVDWVDKNQCSLGCKGLEDSCLGQQNCTFHKLKVDKNRQQIEQPPFDFQEASRFLESRYKDHGDGYLMVWILMCLRRVQMEKVTGEVIFIGYRGIASLLRDHFKRTIEPMTILRRINDLVAEGMLEIVVKGKSGSFGQPANGYRFLPWKPPCVCATDNP